jgi:hypothetical protein
LISISKNLTDAYCIKNCIEGADLITLAARKITDEQKKLMSKYGQNYYSKKKIVIMVDYSNHNPITTLRNCKKI